MQLDVLYKPVICIILGSTVLVPICFSLPENVLASATPRSNIVNNTNTISPSFPNQEIIDPYRDWINLKTKTFTKLGDRFTDIRAVDYHSDGDTLNAIIWLFFPPRVEPPSSYQFVNYGMYIDADFDTTTGYGGIEYKFEIGCSNETKKWTKVLEKWSHFGDTVVVNNQTIPYTEFTKDGAQYALLSADLDSMLSPSKYKVIFYAEAKKTGSFITDFTRLLAIPPLVLKVSTSPNMVELRKEESNTIQVTVETTQGYEPTVNLNAVSQSKYLNLDFTQNDTSIINDYKLRIPSYGVATVPLTITSSKEAPIGPHTFFIFANSSFPPEEFIKPKEIREQQQTTSFLPSSALASENVFTQSSLLVMLEKALTWIDNLSDFWNKLGNFISFISGIVTGTVGPWVFNKIKEALNVRRGQRK